MVHKTIFRQIYNKPQTLNRQIVRKYVKKFCKYYARSITRKKQGECLICYSTGNKFVSIPCCCEQLICGDCFQQLLNRNQFKCMFCREKVDFEDYIFENVFSFIKANKALRQKLIVKRIRRINTYFYKKKWKIPRLIVLSKIFNQIKDTEYDLNDIVKFKFTNTFTLKVHFKNGEVVYFNISNKDNEL